MCKVVGDVIEDGEHNQSYASNDSEEPGAVCAEFVDISLGLDELVEGEIDEQDGCNGTDHEERFEFLGSDIRNESIRAC